MNHQTPSKARQQITRALSGSELVANRAFLIITYTAGAGTILLLLYILFVIGSEAAPAVFREGLGFLTRSVWAPGRGEFGIAAEIFGTLYSSILALLIAGFFGVAIAIFLTQDFLPAKLAYGFRTIVELLAAIPSVVYGLWGIFVVIPTIRPAANFLHENFGFIPFFGTSMGGPGLAPAVIVLSIMVLPTVAAISQDAFRLVPFKMKEAAYGMGTTRWEAIFRVMLPTASRGIFASLVLGFGRALGETMALAMIIGNANQISWSLFAPANTLAALLASTFPEAGDIERGALMYAAVILLLLTLAVNMIGVFVISLSSRQQAN